MFSGTDPSKRDVFLMSFLGLRVMSDRREMKDEQLRVIEKYMKQDIISVPDIIEPDIINLAEDDECIKDNEGLKNEAKVEQEGNNSIAAVPIDEEVTEKKHPIYQGNRTDKKLLSNALSKFKLDTWEEPMNWYRKDPSTFFGDTILEEGNIRSRKISVMRKKLGLKVRIFIIIFLFMTMIAINLFVFVVAVSHR